MVKFYQKEQASWTAKQRFTQKEEKAFRLCYMSKNDVEQRIDGFMTEMFGHRFLEEIDDNFKQ